MRSKCTSARRTRVYSRVMIIDFQHHFLPLELAARHGFKPGESGNLLEGGVPKLTVHQKLYDLDAQSRDMDVSGIDVAVFSCNLGCDGSLEDCRLINDAAAEWQRGRPARFA